MFLKCAFAPGSPPTLEPAACFEPASAWDTPIFEAKELNLDRGVVISCSAHTSQDSGIVGTDFRSCRTRETAEDHTVRELSEGEGEVDVHLTRVSSSASSARSYVEICVYIL